MPIWISTNWKASVRFWIRKIFTIVLPFFILAYCNFCIVMRLRSQQRNNKSYNTINNNSNNYCQKNYNNNCKNNYRNNYNFDVFKQQQQNLFNNNDNLIKSSSPLPLLSSPMPSVTTLSQQSKSINSDSKLIE